MRFDHVKHELYPNTADQESFGYDRVERLLRLVRGEPVSEGGAVEGFEVFSERMEPHSPGLGRRMWYGGASLSSAQWAGEHGMNFLTSSVVKAEESEDFAEIQLSHVRAFRARHPDGERPRVSQGLVVIPTDSASAEQRAKYEAYAAKRTPRTTAPQGPARMLFALDLVGTSEQIADKLYAHAAFAEVDEVAFSLPFSFEHEDYVQILTDMAQRLGPALGWSPSR